MDLHTFDGKALGEQVVAIVRDYMARRTDALARSMNALEHALAHYAGPYDAQKCYPAGAVVTHGGRVWRAAYKTASQPGEGPGWTKWPEAEQ